MKWEAVIELYEGKEIIDYNDLVDSACTRNNFEAWGPFSCLLPSCHWVVNPMKGILDQGLHPYSDMFLAQ